MGTASTMSQTNRSRCGCRSGRSGDRAGRAAVSFVISHTGRPGINSSFHTPKVLSSFHTPDVKIRHFKHRPALWITRQLIRHFTHRHSSLHTPVFVISHTDFVNLSRFLIIFQYLKESPKTCNSILTLFNSLAALQAASNGIGLTADNHHAPLRPVGANPRPPPQKGLRTHQKQTCLSETPPLL